MLLLLHAQSALVFNQDLTSVVLNNLTSNDHKIQKIIHSAYLTKRLKQWTKEEIIGSMTWHGIVPMFPHMSATAQHVWYTCANIKTTALTELTNYALKVDACFVADVSCPDSLIMDKLLKFQQNLQTSAGGGERGSYHQLILPFLPLSETWTIWSSVRLCF